MQLFAKEKSAGEFYWALVLEPDWVQAGIWSLAESKAQITTVSPPIAWSQDEDLLGAVDASLSAAVQSLPEDFGEPTKTVFGVPAFWVESGQIREEHLSKIKSICEELALEPTGFVVLPEAVAHFIKSEEGVPLSAVVAGVGEDFLEVAVFNSGKLAGTTKVARSVSLFSDLTEGLSRFAEAETLPARVIIYDGKEGELEEEKQALINADWANLEKIKLYHPPQIEFFPCERKVLAVALAGGAEIGGVLTVETKRKSEPSGDEAEMLENIVVPAKRPTAEDFGFVIDKDIAQGLSRAPGTPVLRSDLASSGSRSKWTEKLSSFWQKLFEFFKKFKAGRSLLVWIGTGLFGLVILAFVFWWFYPKARVTVYVMPKKFEEKLDLIIDPTLASDNLAEKTLSGKVLTTEVSSDKTIATSGRKKVGEKAHGTIKIQNGTAALINLKTGTVLSSVNDLKFTLDSSASISAALSPSLPGSQTAEMTASDIGAEYNLAKDESFKVANYPKAEVDAIATAPFSGGSSREITAVSAEDQKTLEETLVGELQETAQKKLLSDLSSGEIFIDNSQETTLLSKVFSKKVGDEAENLKATISLKVGGLVVTKDSLITLSKKTLEQSIPAGFVLRDDQLNFSFESVESEGEKRAFILRVTVNFLPDVNTGAIIKQIRGKSSKSVENYLATIPGFSRADINIKPLFLGRLGTMPRISRNIHLEISTER